MKMLGVGLLLFTFNSVCLLQWQVTEGAPATTVVCASNDAVDVVFLLDASSRIRPPDFRRQLQFVRDVTDWFTVGRESTRVGLVTFADRPSIHVYLDDHLSKSNLQDAIVSVRQSGGHDTRTAEALRYVRETLLDVGQSGRPSLLRVIVLVADGQSANQVETAEQARLAREAGISLFAVGVGPDVDLEELEAIVSRPADDHTLLVENYDTLGHVREQLAVRICSAAANSRPKSTTDAQLHQVTDSRFTVKIIEHPEGDQSGGTEGSERGNDVAELSGRDIEVVYPGHDTTADVIGKNSDVDGSGSPEVQAPIELSEPVAEGDTTWLWRYDEHGQRIWYRIRGGRSVSGTGSRSTDSSSGNSNTDYDDEEIWKKLPFDTPFDATTPFPEADIDGSARGGYWMIDEFGTYVWFRRDVAAGQYVRDRSVTMRPPIAETERQRQLTWTGVGDWYWAVDANIHRVWFQLSRIGVDVFELTGPTDSWNGQASWNGKGSAPHVYLSSGPGGRGGYWAIDEHGHYVWHHYVGPNQFERDESTAVEVNRAAEDTPNRGYGLQSDDKKKSEQERLVPDIEEPKTTQKPTDEARGRDPKEHKEMPVPPADVTRRTFPPPWWRAATTRRPVVTPRPLPPLPPTTSTTQMPILRYQPEVTTTTRRLVVETDGDVRYSDGEKTASISEARGRELAHHWDERRPPTTAAPAALFPRTYPVPWWRATPAPTAAPTEKRRPDEAEPKLVTVIINEEKPARNPAGWRGNQAQQHSEQPEVAAPSSFPPIWWLTTRRPSPTSTTTAAPVPPRQPIIVEATTMEVILAQTERGGVLLEHQSRYDDRELEREDDEDWDESGTEKSTSDLTDEVRRRDPNKPRHHVNRRTFPPRFRLTTTRQPASTAVPRGGSDGSGTRRGFWAPDEFGRLTWHTYPDAEEERENEETGRNEIEGESTTVMSTSTAAWKEKEIVNGYWAIDASGRYVWRTYPQDEEEDSTTAAATTTIAPTSTTTASPTTTTTQWRSLPRHRPINQPTGHWIRDKWSGKMIWVTRTTTMPPRVEREERTTLLPTTKTVPRTTTTTTPKPTMTPKPTKPTTMSTTTISLTSTSTPSRTTMTRTTAPRTTTTIKTDEDELPGNWEEDGDDDLDRDGGGTLWTDVRTETSTTAAAATTSARRTPTRVPLPPSTTSSTLSSKEYESENDDNDEEEVVDEDGDATEDQMKGIVIELCRQYLLKKHGFESTSNMTFWQLLRDFNGPMSIDDIVAAAAPVAPAGYPVDESLGFLRKMLEKETFNGSEVLTMDVDVGTNRTGVSGPRGRGSSGGGGGATTGDRQPGASKNAGQGARRNVTSSSAAAAWEQFIREPSRRRPGGRKRPGAGGRLVTVGPTANTDLFRPAVDVKPTGRYETSFVKPTARPTTDIRRRNRTMKAMCSPQRPLDIIFAVDPRSSSPVHVRHLWQIAFEVISRMRMDDGRVRVRFVPETSNNQSDGGSSAASGGHQHQLSQTVQLQQAYYDRNYHHQQNAANRTRSVVDVLDDLVDALRRPESADDDDADHRRAGLRRVGFYLTDGRSPDTSGTVRAVDRVTRHLPRRADLIAVGVGPDVSLAQLAAVARGRRDRLLSAFTGAPSGSYRSIKRLSMRLVKLVCRPR